MIIRDKLKNQRDKNLLHWYFFQNNLARSYIWMNPRHRLKKPASKASLDLISFVYHVRIVYKTPLKL